MKVAVRDLLELAALLLGLATVAVATHAVWPSLLTTAVFTLYVSHTWQWTAEITVRRVRLPRWIRRRS